MNAPAPPARIEFDGSVICRPGNGAVSLTLSGERAGAVQAVHLVAAEAAGIAGLPPVLHEVRLEERPAAASGPYRCFELQSRELRRELRARGLQCHRDAGREFFRAVPPARVPMARRAGWTVLLLLLRVPGFVGLLRRFREST